MKRFFIKWYSMALPLLLQGCYVMDNDGIAGDDEFAKIVGICGLIAFVVGLGKPSARLVVVGVILFIA